MNSTERKASPVKKQVRVVLPHEEDGDVDDDDGHGGGDRNPASSASTESAHNVQISVTASFSTSPTKSPSPTKKRRPDPANASCTTSGALIDIDAEIEREALRRRNSEAGLSMVDGSSADLVPIVVSLRRQNKDLREKLDEIGGGAVGGVGQGSSRSEEKLRKLAEKECDELRTTVARLERLIKVEREERAVSEQQTLKLLEDVKDKWHEKGEERVKALRADLRAANVIVQEMEIDLLKKQTALDQTSAELEAANNVKACLKAKLKECKSKLEMTVARYDEKSALVERLETRLKQLESQKDEKEAENSRSRRRATVTLNENKAELQLVREMLDKIKDNKADLEAELREARSTSSALNLKVEGLSKDKADLKREYDSHLARCDALLIDLRAENSKLRATNESLEEELRRAEEKLESKGEKLRELESVLDKLESRIPAHASLSSKTKEYEEKVDQLQKELSLQKVELRIAERKANEQKDRISLLREMLKEEKDRREKLEACSDSGKEELERFRKELDKEKAERTGLEAKNVALSERVKKLNEEVACAAKDSESLLEAEAKLQGLEKKLGASEQELDRLRGVDKHYNLMKNICYELEDQIKEYERLMEKHEKGDAKLKEANEALVSKSQSLSTELIKVKTEVNELRSVTVYKDTQIKDLSEKNKESESFYDTEAKKWRKRCEESSAEARELAEALGEARESLASAARERDSLLRSNDYLQDESVKLKEEAANLITGIHSLKDSNVMLQGSVRELAEKLSRRDAEIERLKSRLKEAQADIDIKDHEHRVTLDQLKKLTKHLPEQAQATPSRGSKKESRLLVNRLL